MKLRGLRSRGELIAGTVLLMALAGCFAPAMLLPSSSQLMWALLTPLVGFDPNRVNLFEQPLLRNRMVALLGERYEPAVRLLRTADQLRREGPLFYVVSRYTPIPEIADRAGMVWNSETNQLAVALLKGDVVDVVSERIEAAVDARIGAAHDAALGRAEEAGQAARDALASALPVWPAELAWARLHEQPAAAATGHESGKHVGEALDPASREDWEAPEEAFPEEDGFPVEEESQEEELRGMGGR